MGCCLLCGSLCADDCSWVSRYCDVAYETTLKEPSSLSHSANLMAQYVWDSHAYGLDPAEPIVNLENRVAHVIFFLPGMGGGPFCFLDWARSYQEAGIRNIYTIALSQSDEDPVPVERLIQRVNEVAEQCLALGAEDVHVSLQGHSLGAIAAAKTIWCEEQIDPCIHLDMMISIAGRLRYVDNRFAWFCEDVRPDIEALYASYVGDPTKATLYTISGALDELVPTSSVHFQQLPERERTIPCVGHLGVLYADETIQQSTAWTREWAWAS